MSRDGDREYSAERKSASRDRSRSPGRNASSGRDRDRDRRDDRSYSRGGGGYQGGYGGGSYGRDDYYQGYGSYGGSYGGYGGGGYGGYDQGGYGGGYYGGPPGGGWGGYQGGGGWGGGGPWGGRNRSPPRRNRGPPSRATEEEKKTSTCIWVGNLPYSSTDSDIRDLFEKYGQLTRVTVPMDRTGSRNKGFAFVEFETRKEAEDAYDKRLENRAVRLDWDVGRDRKEAAAQAAGGAEGEAAPAGDYGAAPAY